MAVKFSCTSLLKSHAPAAAWPLVAIGGGHPSKLRACKIIEGPWHVPFSPGNNFKPDFYGDLDPLRSAPSNSQNGGPFY